MQLLGWLQEKLPECHKLPAEVNLIIPPLYSCLEDRSGEVRKKANATVPVLISKIGYEVMAKEATKLKVQYMYNCMSACVHINFVNMDSFQFNSQRLESEAHDRDCTNTKL